MTQNSTSRRDFLSSSASLLGGGWIAAHGPAILALSACARDAARRGEPLTVLTTAEGRTMAAFAAQILPSDSELPGAEEAGAVYFVDRALGAFFQPLLEPVRAGVAALDEGARVAGANSFADLSADQQVEGIRQIEQAEFFAPMRMLVVMGVFSDPMYGGHRDGVGFRILDMEHAAAYEPPFGWYDAEYARSQGAGSAE